MLTATAPRLPHTVAELSTQAVDSGLPLSCTPDTGALLRTLAASKPGGRLLELGTGMGVSTAWLAEGMTREAHLTTVENNPGITRHARRLLAERPVKFITDDASDFLLTYTGPAFDLVRRLPPRQVLRTRPPAAPPRPRRPLHRRRPAAPADLARGLPVPRRHLPGADHHPDRSDRHRPGLRQRPAHRHPHLTPNTPRATPAHTGRAATIPVNPQPAKDTPLVTSALTNPADITEIDPAAIVDALITCCALAWKGNPIAGLDLQPGYAHRLITRTRAEHTDQQILAWRTDYTVSADSWDLRWGWALRMTRRHFRSHPGLAALPTDHNELPTTLPTPAATA